MSDLIRINTRFGHFIFIEFSFFFLSEYDERGKLEESWPKGKINLKGVQPYGQQRCLKYTFSDTGIKSMVAATGIGGAASILEASEDHQGKII